MEWDTHKAVGKVQMVSDKYQWEGWQDPELVQQEQVQCMGEAFQLQGIAITIIAAHLRSCFVMSEYTSGNVPFHYICTYTDTPRRRGAHQVTIQHTQD